MLPSMIPRLGTILGGNIALHGNNLTLACFHGINFRSKSWALFSLNEAYILFATEAQKTQEGGLFIKQTKFVRDDIEQFITSYCTKEGYKVGLNQLHSTTRPPALASKTNIIGRMSFFYDFC